MIQIFISYAREDAKVAQELSRDLAVAGFSPWLDSEQILPGVRWQAAIKRALRDSRFVLLLLSNDSISKRGYIQKEIREALELLDEFPDSEVFLVPILIEPCEVRHPRLAELQWVELFPSYEKGLAKIILALQEKGPPDSLPFTSPEIRLNSPSLRWIGKKLILFLLAGIMLVLAMKYPGITEYSVLGDEVFRLTGSRSPGENLIADRSELSAAQTSNSTDLLKPRARVFIPPELKDISHALLLSSIEDGVGFGAGSSRGTVPLNNAWPIRNALAEGRPVVLYMWASWCVPCVTKDLPIIAGLQEKYDRAVFFGLGYEATPREEEFALELAQRTGSNFLYFAESDKVINELFQAEDSLIFPAYVLFGPEGRLVLRFHGSLGSEENLDRLESSLTSMDGA